MANSNCGFTYLEMVVSLAIVSLIASLCFPLLAVQQERQKQHELSLALREIRGAIDAYKEAYDQGKILPREGSHGYPRNLLELVEGVEDASRPDQSKLYFLRRIPLNPLVPAVTPREEQWVALGYRDPQSPQSFGDELYDVKADEIK
jgi:general secretion pathway protein G